MSFGELVPVKFFDAACYVKSLRIGAGSGSSCGRTCGRLRVRGGTEGWAVARAKLLISPSQTPWGRCEIGFREGGDVGSNFL